MDTIATAAVQKYNGGIMFLSYVISVIGAQTTLELLSRRTHISGLYNWFLLISAAFVMGAVSIWCMHFIGNNSMYLLLGNEVYQLSYSAGYTAASLVVVIACMFIAFAFVGITEEAKLSRILPSGMFAGLGIVCMHYLGQFAIDYFVLVYKKAYIVGAAIIACVAVTVALFIFFKLREKWMNQWYKRLGCAMLMAVAVCGMHYTALVGTIFYKPNYTGSPPVPKLQTPALIGVMLGVVLSACAMLLYVIIRRSHGSLPLAIYKNTKKRLILDVVFFDPMNRILVKTDGTLPMKEIVEHLELTESRQEFTTKHPLFIRLYNTMIEKTSSRSVDKRPSAASYGSSTEAHEMIENQFLVAASDLKDELHLDEFADLGILSEIVVATDTILKANIFNKSAIFRASTGSNWSKKIFSDKTKENFDFAQEQLDDSKEKPEKTSEKIKRLSYIATKKKKKRSHKTNRWNYRVDDEETAIESTSTTAVTTPTSTAVGHFSTINAISSSEEAPAGEDEDNMSSSAVNNNDRLSVEDSDGEDRHIFLVKKLVNEKDVSRLLAQGYRFAEPIFIAKTMAAKLKIPTDNMRQHFIDMQQLSDSLCALTQHDYYPTVEEPTPDPTKFKASTKANVFVGCFVLINEGNDDILNLEILVDKAKRFSFPVLPLKTDNNIVTQLDRNEIDFICNLQGQSLFDIAQLEQKLAQEGKETHHPSIQFIRAFQDAARQLIDSTSYSKALYQTSKLHTTIMDLPPFSLTAGPCQLIVFKSFVNAPGTLAAVNHTFSEPHKCIPISIYKPLCGFITDQAAAIYQQSNSHHSHPTYFIQQQMYRQAGGYQYQQQQYPTTDDESQKTENLEMIDMDRLQSSETLVVSNDPFSLPPPPRAKRNRFKLTNAILNNSPFDILSPTSPTSERPYLPQLKQLSAPPLTVLSTSDRLWWINPLVEETIHSNM
ncbi:hypothetical protein K501DRAFT_324283 [Backusella circina FSU 941]|nr:hypothetical protein K501DRAFT_324283 [Backusella circina FSU 941]